MPSTLAAKAAVVAPLAIIFALRGVERLRLSSRMMHWLSMPSRMQREQGLWWSQLRLLRAQGAQERWRLVAMAVPCG